MYRNQKLRYEDKVHIAKDIVEHGLRASYVARLYNISTRWAQKIAKEYRERGEVLPVKNRGRRKYRSYPDNLDGRIIELHKKYRVGAVTIGKVLRKKYGIKVDNNYIHRVLKMNGYARDEPNKRVRKKPWVRYERMHSLSAVHMDWYYDNVTGKWVCAVLDDASRMVLAMIETSSPTADASVKVLDEAYQRYLHIRPIEAVIVDHGTQFYANKRDKNGNANHTFERYCKDRGINQILCRYNHPQSNGKIERFFQTYSQWRHDFDSMDEFLHWYNCIRPHMSLNSDELETPERAFYRKAQAIILGNFWNFAEKQMEVTKNECSAAN